MKTPSINRDADVKQGIVDTGEELLTRVESIVWATVRQGNTTPAAMLRDRLPPGWRIEVDPISLL